MSKPLAKQTQSIQCNRLSFKPHINFQLTVTYWLTEPNVEF